MTSQQSAAIARLEQAAKDAAAKPAAVKPAAVAATKPAAVAAPKITPIKPAPDARIADVAVAQAEANIVNAKQQHIAKLASTSVAVNKPAQVMPPVQSIAVPLQFINAALLAAGKDEQREYLNGVFLHAEGNEMRVCGTDGSRMIVSRFTIPEGDKLPTWTAKGVILDRDQLSQVAALLKSDGEVIIEHSVTEAVLTLRSVDQFARFQFKPKEGQYPNYAKVIESINFLTREGSGAVAIQTKYLKGATDVAKKLKASALRAFIGGPDDAAVFTFEGAPDTMLVIMPTKGGEAITDGVLKLVGKGSVQCAIRMAKCQLTRTTKMLKAQKGEEAKATQATIDAIKAKIERLEDTKKVAAPTAKKDEKAAA